jgi:hypothetical protein
MIEGWWVSFIYTRVISIFLGTVNTNRLQMNMSFSALS